MYSFPFPMRSFILSKCFFYQKLCLCLYKHKCTVPGFLITRSLICLIINISPCVPGIGPDPHCMSYIVSSGWFLICSIILANAFSTLLNSVNSSLILKICSISFRKIRCNKTNSPVF